MAYYDDNGHVLGDLRSPVRNNYFYGKLLDARHFTLEQTYFNHKRWLLNRLVTGYGVVCGLDLGLTDERDHVVVLPGLALDKWGREIIVPYPSAPIRLERLPGAEQGDEEWVHLCLAYYECESDPAPVLVNECSETGPCAADTIRERYKIFMRPGRAPEPPHECTLEDLVGSRGLRFEALVRWVTQGCDDPPLDTCIPLADIFVAEEEGRCNIEDIHTEHRPLVYSNDLLYELILALAEEVLQSRRGGKKG